MRQKAVIWFTGIHLQGSSTTHYHILPVLHPPHKYPAKFGCVSLYVPYLFGKELFSMQDKLVNNKHTHFLKTPDIFTSPKLVMLVKPATKTVKDQVFGRK